LLARNIAFRLIPFYRYSGKNIYEDSPLPIPNYTINVTFIYGQSCGMISAESDVRRHCFHPL